jgi:hypothetical protein
MITLQKQSGVKGFAFRLGNHTGECFQAASTRDFYAYLAKFGQDIRLTPYPKTDNDLILSAQTQDFIDGYGQH